MNSNLISCFRENSNNKFMEINLIVNNDTETIYFNVQTPNEEELRGKVELTFKM